MVEVVMLYCLAEIQLNALNLPAAGPSRLARAGGADDGNLLAGALMSVPEVGDTVFPAYANLISWLKDLPRWWRVSRAYRSEPPVGLPPPVSCPGRDASAAAAMLRHVDTSKRCWMGWVKFF